MLRAKLRRKARRIVVAEIMLPLILIGVLGITVAVCALKLLRINKIFVMEDTVEGTPLRIVRPLHQNTILFGCVVVLGFAVLEHLLTPVLAIPRLGLLLATIETHLLAKTRNSYLRLSEKWIINLGVLMTYSVFDLGLVYFLRTGVRELNSTKCRIWVTLQICVLCLFTVAVMKRCNASLVGFHFFELIFLYVGVFIYKVHHIAFVYNLVDLIIKDKLPKNRAIFKRRMTLGPGKSAAAQVP